MEQDDLLSGPIEAFMSPIVRDLEDLEAVRPRTPQLEDRDYEFVRPLGRGGMGATMLARTRMTGQLVAIKELNPEEDRRFLDQEYKALRRLSHPNIVRFLQLHQLSA